MNLHFGHNNCSAHHRAASSQSCKMHQCTTAAEVRWGRLGFRCRICSLTAKTKTFPFTYDMGHQLKAAIATQSGSGTGQSLNAAYNFGAGSRFTTATVNSAITRKLSTPSRRRAMIATQKNCQSTHCNATPTTIGEHDDRLEWVRENLQPHRQHQDLRLHLRHAPSAQDRDCHPKWQRHRPAIECGI
jgi:hypothetical protein